MRMSNLVNGSKNWIKENSNIYQFEPSNSKIANIKEVYNFEFIEAKNQKVEILDGTWRKMATY